MITVSHAHLVKMLNDGYTFAFIYDRESNTYTGTILEFPGCIAQGAMPMETWDSLIGNALSWMRATLESGNKIPEPMSSLNNGIWRRNLSTVRTDGAA